MRNHGKLVSQKNIRVSEDTQIHMTTVYSRNGVGPKNNMLRSFNFVIKGLLISSALVGAVVLHNGSAVAASSQGSVGATPSEQNIVVNDQFRDEQAMISNLKMANKVLIAAIHRGELNVNIYDNVMKKLVSIETKLMMDGTFNNTDTLLPVLKDSDSILKSAISFDSSNDIFAKRADSIDALTKVQDLLGVSQDQRGGDGLADQGMVVTKAVASPRQEIKVEAVTQSALKTVNVIIDGQAQHFDQSAVVKDGSTLVPLRGIFETLGAKVTWDNATKTVTAVKGDITIKLTLGQQTAHVNGNAVPLAVKAQTINGNTMVPLRFISEALGADVKWNPDTYTATITSTGGQVQTPPTQNDSGQYANGIKVQYGKHTYGSANQAEYDKVMAIVQKAVAGYDSVKFDSSGRHEQHFQMYLNGDRASNYPDGSANSNGLTVVDSVIGQLAEAGASKNDIEKVFKATIMANDLLASAKVVLDGSPSSAYDALVRGVKDCDPEAYVYSAVLDAMGYNTMVVGSTAHADPIVEVNGSWYTCMGMGFRGIDMHNAHNAIILSQPTHGVSPF